MVIKNGLKYAAMGAFPQLSLGLKAAAVVKKGLKNHKF